MNETVKTRRIDDVALVTLNRPESYNALNIDLAEAMMDALIAASIDEKCRAVVVTGEGKAFCSGGDLKWITAYDGPPAQALRHLAGRFHLAVVEIRRMAKPVIAAVNGVAAGAGFSLALACDLRVMAKSAIFKQAYTSSGLCIDGGGTYSLPRLVGIAKSLEIAAFDKPISSEQALAWGLTTKIADDGKAVDVALEMAAELAKGSINAFARAKALITDSFETPLEKQLELERDGIASCAAHPDGREGISAFVAKRKPVFKKD